MVVVTDERRKVASGLVASKLDGGSVLASLRTLWRLKHLEEFPNAGSFAGSSLIPVWDSSSALPQVARSPAVAQVPRLGGLQEAGTALT